jgi:hypothetical protein
MKTKRIDQYICIDVDQIVADELNDVLTVDPDSFSMKEDREYYKRLLPAIEIVLEHWSVPE